MVGFVAHTMNCVVLLYLTKALLEAWLRSSRQQQQQQQPAPAKVLLASLAATLLYSVHPLHTEVIGWASAGPYASAALALHLALLFSIAPPQHPPQRWYHARIGSFDVTWLSLALYIAAVMLKGVAIFMPLTLIAIDYGIQRGGGGALPRFCMARARARLPLLATMLVMLVPVLWANEDLPGERSAVDTVALSAAQRVVKTLVTPWFYLLQAVVPVDLRPHYVIAEGALSVAGSGRGV